MLSRLTLSLALILAVLVAPAAPLDLNAALTSRISCCIRIQVDPCQSCPINSGPTNSGSACCSVQAPCFVCFSHGGDDFIAGMRALRFAVGENKKVTQRFQRPPIPPPRTGLS